MKKITLLITAILMNGLLSAQTAQDSLLLFYTFDNNLEDVSGHDLHATNNGASLTTDRFGNPNSAYTFDGVDDHMNLPHSDTIKGGFPFSFSMWVNVDDSSSNDNFFLSFDGGTGNYYGFWVRLNPTGNGTVTLNYGDGTGAGSQFRRSKIGTIPLNSNKWHHIAGIFESKTELEIYVDGVQDSGATLTGTSNKDVAYTSAGGYVGMATDSSLHFKGAMDELMVWNKVLTADEISQLYNYDNLLLHYTCNGSAVDSSVYGFDGTLNGTSLAQDRDGNVKSAIQFDGIGDYLRLPQHAVLKPELPLSFAVWVNVTDSSQNNTIFYSDGANNAYHGLNIRLNGNGQVSGGYGDSHGSGSQHRRTAVSSISLNSNTWHHVAMNIRGKTDFDIYIDGEKDTAITYSGTSNSAMAYTSNAGYLGYKPSLTVPTYFGGMLDDFRYWRRTISDAEVAALFDADTLTTTVATQSMTTQHVKVYPNPAKDFIQVLGSDIHQIELVDVIGRTMISLRQQRKINVSALPTGIYFLRVNVGAEWITHRIMIQ